MHQELQGTCTAIVLLIKLLFSDVPVAVVVVVLNSLLYGITSTTFPRDKEGNPAIAPSCRWARQDPRTNNLKVIRFENRFEPWR